MALTAPSTAKFAAARPSRRTAVVVRAADEVKVGINGERLDPAQGWLPEHMPQQDPTPSDLNNPGQQEAREGRHEAVANASMHAAPAAAAQRLPGCVSRIHAGFGRIGRLVLRATLNRKDVNVVAINGKALPGQPGLFEATLVTSCQQCSDVC